MEVSSQIYASATLSSENPAPIGDWVERRAFRDSFGEKKISYPWRDLKPGPSSTWVIQIYIKNGDSIEPQTYSTVICYTQNNTISKIFQLKDAVNKD
jgi:hypothetical protein